MPLTKHVVFLACLFMLILTRVDAQEKRYDTLWKRVDELALKKGLTKSALTEVNKIYDLAKKEKQETQVIKALIYKVSLEEISEENAAPKNIIQLEKEITSATPVSSSILSSILAEKYWNYFQQHRSQIYGRTQTANFKKDDITTWGAEDFHSKISEVYQASLKRKELLQQTKLEPYDAIIVKGNARYLRPTLFDLLADRAVDYFSNDERDITKPAYAFEINDERYFLPSATFAAMKIISNDSLSLHHKALLVYQELLAFHASDARPDAFIDADIHRIQFIRMYGVMENKEELYAKALGHISSTYSNEPAAAQAAYLLAEWHANNARQYDPIGDTSHRYEYILARDICQKVMAQKAESEGKSNCLALLKQVLRKELLLETEIVNVPDQPFRTLVNYRNFNQLFFRIVPGNEQLKKQYPTTKDDKYWKQITGAKFIRSWNQFLPATNDLQMHRAEIKIDALPAGEYVLLSSVEDKFSPDSAPLAAQYFYVSGISYVNNGNDYFVLDRESGKPLGNATVQVWVNQYDNVRQNVLTKGETAQSDHNGFFRLANEKQGEHSTRLEILYKNDRLFLGQIRYTYYRYHEENKNEETAAQYEKKNARVFFFTDRSIYRPGQVVYFKAIVITKDQGSEQSKVFRGFKTVVNLYNANGEQADSLDVTTNDFGSYSGTFKLPENVLNGELRLQDQELHGYVSFSVEEYKRPKFYVDYEKIKGSYKVNDTISITASAKAYAGNNIDGATVQYRVVRQPRFIYPWPYWKGIMRATNMEITHGVTTTNSEGNFTIHFKAIPDLTIKKELNPIFDYKVIADITDINGETRSGETIVPVSYKALQLKVVVPGETIPLDSFTTIQISSLNMNGEFEPALAHVTISKLQSPERLVRERYWQQPDQFTMGKEEYLRFFPHDEYQDERNYRSWAKKETMFDVTDSTRPGAKFEIQNTKFKEGWYVIEVVSKDKYGEEVKDVQYVQLYNEKNHMLPSSHYIWTAQNNPKVEPGETSTIQVGSSANNVFMIQHIDSVREPGVSPPELYSSQKTPGIYRFISLDNEKKTFKFAATEDDRGGFGVYHFFVKNNRFYFSSSQVIVPWSNKELRITYETFRDKTLPGSEEKWKLKINGYKNEKVAAELLASMYDASLDQFKPHGWAVPGIWPMYAQFEAWNGITNFTGVQSEEKYIPGKADKYYIKTYDRLLSFNNGGRIRIRGLATAPIYDQVNQNRVLAIPDWITEDDAGKVEMAKYTRQEIVMDELAIEPVNTRIPGDAAVRVRKNFNETAFFFPDLKTDAEGNIEFSFTLPDALTRWKFQGLAYTKDAAFGYSTKDIITQKQLMVQPNAPRFLREGDRIELGTKIVNMTANVLTGTVQLELLDAATLHPLNAWFDKATNQSFTAQAGKSTIANFSIRVPDQYNSALVYRFVAKTSVTGTDGVFSDAEEASLPILKNSILVTETMPLNVRGNSTKNFRFEKLLNSSPGDTHSNGITQTMKHHSLIVEFTANPTWLAVQALPYLAETKYENSEQVFNRYYANALALKIVNAAPRIRGIFEKWKQFGESSDALLSNLQKNQELKAALLEETPWVLDAKNEAQQKKNIALLFDMVKMTQELEASLDKLKQFQSPNGGFVWCPGDRDDRFITQYILTGFGHLKKLGALPPSSLLKLNDVIKAAISYLDKRISEDYTQSKKIKPKPGSPRLPDLFNIQAQYLYMRSFFPEYGIPGETFPAVNYYRKQSQQFWLQQNKYMQGMIALALSRTGDVKTANDILRSLKENAIVNEEMGMYWKENRSGYYWYQAPVETQSLMIEAFSEITKESETINDLKTWLLKQKQTQNWKTTKATADACYALLLQGTDWLSDDPVVEIILGDTIIKSTGEKQEAGTGYFKKIIEGPRVTPAMGDISVKISAPLQAGLPQTQQGKGIAWGAVYWQYFEKLDKITPAATPLKLVKKLFIQKNSDTGPVLLPVNEGDVIHIGDKIKVRIELTVDRDMEYVHMKDMRASAMEPVNVLSTYKWQGGLGYYETTRDASTNFFFSWLPKGTYVFEYPLFVTHAGNFSNGVTSIQCMYAPEFASHSEGIRVTVK